MIDWSNLDVDQAVDLRSKGSNILIAAAIYDAAISDGGRFTVGTLVEDWKLTDAEADDLLASVKDGWSQGRWTDARVQVERRNS